MPGDESYGYHGDDQAFERELTTRFPSLPKDGDPFFHEPVAPELERHGNWRVYNPTKSPVDAFVADELALQHGAETVDETYEATTFHEIIDREFGEK